MDERSQERDRAAARARFDAAAAALAADPSTARLVAEEDRIGRMMFGVPGANLTEDQGGAVITWIIKERPVARLHRGAVRDAAVALSRLTLLYARIGDRLGCGWHEDGYLDVAVEAGVAGTVSALSEACERLEASWHDDRLTREEGIEAVEAVEALRLALRRMEACGLAALRDFDASDPWSRPAMP